MKLLEQMQQKIKMQGLSPKTFETYAQHCEDFLHDLVRTQIESMRVLHADDVRQGLNGVSLPDGFGRKSPKAHLEFKWWYLFASDGIAAPK